MKSVVLAILNYNGRNHLQELLPTALAAAQCYPGKARVLVLDNRSTRDDVDWVGKHYPDAKVVVAPRNDFLFSYNWLLGTLEEEIVVLLNNDLRVREDFIVPLTRHFARNDVFAVSASSRNWEDSEYSFGPLQLEQHHGINYWVPEFGRQALSNTLFASGGFMAVDRLKFQMLGGFNRLFYPAYGEDLDLCFRAWRRGWRCLFEPESIVLHRESASWNEQSTLQRSLNLRASLLFRWSSLPARGPFLKRWAYQLKVSFKKILDGEWWYPVCILRTWWEWMLIRNNHRALKVSAEELDKISRAMEQAPVRPR